MSQWFIQPGLNNGTVCIDDALLNNIDCSSIPANIYVIFWYGEKGEILYNHDDRPALREPFYDITPYVPVFDNWLAAAATIPSPPLSLRQSKYVKTSEVDALFASKRQLPILYGGHLWDGSDAATGAMSDQIAAITTPADPSGAINSSTAALAASVNQSLTALIGSVNQSVTTIVDGVNATTTSIASDATTADQAVAGSGGAGFVVDQTNAINDSFAGDNSNAINDMLATLKTGITDAITQHAYFLKGLLAGGTPPGTPLDGTQPTFAAASFVDGSHPPPASVPSVSAPPISAPPVSAPPVSSTPIPPTSAPNITWPDFDGTPVTLTYSQFTTILSQLTSRRGALQLTRTTHKNNIAGLTTIADVIAYDITQGW